MPSLPRISSPAKIQNYVNTLRMRIVADEPIVRPPLAAIAAREASCMEGALIAAAILEKAGGRPLLLDLRVARNDETDVDHVVALFRQNGHWGAISKTSHAVLRYREPIYRTIRELALSYFHEYFTHNGKKTLRSFSKPFDVRKAFGKNWADCAEDLYEIACALDDSPHEDFLPKGTKLRLADPIEIAAGKLLE